MTSTRAVSSIRHLLLVGGVALIALLGVGCLDRPGPRPDRGTAQGATGVSFRTADGVTLSGLAFAYALPQTGSLRLEMLAVDSSGSGISFRAERQP